MHHGKLIGHRKLTQSCNPFLSAPLPRRHTIGVNVGGVNVGGNAPIVVQSMTNTDTADIKATVEQVAALANAGSELVRITVDKDEAAAAVPHIRDQLEKRGLDVPLVGDFHYIGHKLLADHPACAEALAKYRINPGNVGFKEKKDKQFSAIVETAIRHNKPVRIGVNWGSLDQVLLTRLMDENSAKDSPLTAEEIMRETIVQSALLSGEQAEEIGLGRDKIIISAKVSQVQDLIAVYSELAQRSDYALHLGLTEAGMGTKGVVASSAAMAIILQQGNWRYNSNFAYAQAKWRSNHRSTSRARVAASYGLSIFHSNCCRMPGLWANHINRFSGTGRKNTKSIT